MKTIIKTRWDGGVYDPRETVLNGCSSSRHFMLNKTKLTPYRDMETEALDSGTLANQRITDVIRYTYTGTTTRIFGLGQASTSNAYPKFYQKATANDPTAAFQAIANGEDTSGAVIPGTLIGYNGALYCLKTKTNQTYLVKHVYASSISETLVGNSPSNGVVPQMFIHPKDNKLYMATGYTMGVLDTSGTFATRDFSTAHDITAICPYGNNIKIGMFAKDGSGSVSGIWSGSTTSSALIDVVNWGSDALLILENLGDVVIGVSGISVGGASDVGTQNTVTVRAYSGGTPQFVQKIESIGSLGSKVYPLRAKRNDTLYFPMSAYLNGTRVHQIWSIYKNEAGQFVVAPDRKINNNTEVTTDNIIGLSMIGDYAWVSFGPSSTGSLMRTNDQESFTATSSYETLVNPGISPDDRDALKRLTTVSLRCGSPSGASHTVTLSYSADGATHRTIYTGASSAKVRVIEEVAEGANNNEPFVEAREYIFKIESTGNGEIYELKYGYEVIPTQF